MLSSDHLKALARARDQLCALDESPAVTELAAQAGLCPGPFIRRFAALYGDTPHQLRVRHRLHHARQLLGADQLSVTRVCLEVGFSSHGSFSTLFRRRFGVSPSQYRRQARTLVQVQGPRAHDITPHCFDLFALACAKMRAPT